MTETEARLDEVNGISEKLLDLPLTPDIRARMAYILLVRTNQLIDKFQQEQKPPKPNPNLCWL